jgi:hypothetical protein
MRRINPSRFWTRVVIAIISTVIGFALAGLLSETNLLKEAKEAGYVAAQKELASAKHETGDVVLVDLSTLISRRSSDPLVPGSNTDFELSDQYVGLKSVLKDLSSAKPKAIFIDWVVTMPEAFRKKNSKEFAFATNVSPDLQRSYRELFEYISKLDIQPQVMILGDEVEEIRAKKQQVFPKELTDFSLVSGALSQGEWNRFVPYSPMQSMSLNHIPSFTDAIISGYMLKDKVVENPRKNLFFNAVAEEHGKKKFWIDFGYAPTLLRNAISKMPVDLKITDDWKAKIKGKIVILADISEPHEMDRFDFPLSREILVMNRLGEKTQIRQGGGGVVHGCALLTRIKDPLYALEDGVPEWIVFGVVNITIAMLAWLFGVIAARWVSEPKKESVESLFDLIFIIGFSFVTILWIPSWLARSRLLVPQIETFLVTRFLDIILIVIVLVISLLKPRQTEERKDLT